MQWKKKKKIRRIWRRKKKRGEEEEDRVKKPKQDDSMQFDHWNNNYHFNYRLEGDSSQENAQFFCYYTHNNRRSFFVALSRF